MLSIETLATAEALSGTTAQGEPAGPAGNPGQPADPAPAIDFERCKAEAAMWLAQLDKLLQAKAPAKFRNSVAAFHDREVRDGIAEAAAECMVFYGVTGLDVVSHPLVKLACAMLPVGIGAYLDWREIQADRLAIAASAPPPPAPVRSPVDDATRSPPPPPNDLHTKV